MIGASPDLLLVRLFSAPSEPPRRTRISRLWRVGSGGSTKLEETQIFCTYNLISGRSSCLPCINSPSMGVLSSSPASPAPRIVIPTQRGECLHEKDPVSHFFYLRTKPSCHRTCLGGATGRRFVAGCGSLRPPKKPHLAACGHFVGWPIKPSGAALYMLHVWNNLEDTIHPMLSPVSHGKPAFCPR